jgi:hypothetical protein
LFCATESVTVALLLPEVRDTAIRLSADVAVHGRQALPVTVTATLRSPPGAGTCHVSPPESGETGANA